MAKSGRKRSRKGVEKAEHTLEKKGFWFYKEAMTTLEKIETAVEHLPSNDLREFRDWFHSFDDSKWDQQIEKDGATGNLDLLAKEALAEYKAGKTTEL